MSVNVLPLLTEASVVVERAQLCPVHELFGKPAVYLPELLGGNALYLVCLGIELGVVSFTDKLGVRPSCRNNARSRWISDSGICKPDGIFWSLWDITFSSLLMLLLGWWVPWRKVGGLGKLGR